MKLFLSRVLVLVLVLYTLDSCTTDAPASISSTAVSTTTVPYPYSSFENETLTLVNNYRVSIGLNALAKSDYISFKAEEHNNYMIANNVVNHNNFIARSEDIMKTLDAKYVTENVAFNYNTPQSVLNAWLASEAHKTNLEGDYTHFGLSIRENPSTGKKYFTNIFAKL
jgi:uncharacterized protein YkwD